MKKPKSKVKALIEKSGFKRGGSLTQARHDWAEECQRASGLAESMMTSRGRSFFSQNFSR
jgi:hypothetical protein